MRALLALFLASTPALAGDYQPVMEKDVFMALVAGKELRNNLYDLSLFVSPDGKISGDALGWKITGTWSWKDGYFCREMDWEGYAIPYNCQLVETREGRIVRFTVDRGTGNSAQFRLR
ncbi:MAG: dihydrodipicolinate reductase [Alphaproteobacteria bacterium]|nr:dihydrodipicolinate reductase [Alphaproteobacteria bacterium]